MLVGQMGVGSGPWDLFNISMRDGRVKETSSELDEQAHGFVSFLLDWEATAMLEKSLGSLLTPSVRSLAVSTSSSISSAAYKGKGRAIGERTASTS
jgi:hypothetical protein